MSNRVFGSLRVREAGLTDEARVDLIDDDFAFDVQILQQDQVTMESTQY